MIPRLLTAALVLSLTACLEDVDFFFAINAGVVQEVAQEGGGIIIGVGVDDAESSTLIDGSFPMGMTLQTDGTIEGIPEETGLFKFTVETVDAEGQSLLTTNMVEIRPPVSTRPD